MGRIAIFLASGLGVGYLPKMPGTYGTLWGVLLFYLARDLSLQSYLSLTVLLILLSWLIIYFAEKRLGSHDSSVIIIDEIAGYWVGVLGLTFSWPTAVLGFVFFRLFDIWKPWPIRGMDKNIPGALGVLLDDLMAGVYTLVVLRILGFFWTF